MILPEEAWKRLSVHCSPLAPVLLERRKADGRVLSEEIRATVNVPFADVSAMDGYAVDAAATASSTLEVAGTIAAGDAPGQTLAPGTALRIMTGAPVPSGADRVVPVELTDGGESQVTFSKVTALGAHIRRQGEVHEIGDSLLSPHTVLTPGGLGLLATHGISNVPVFGTPRVAILTTGDEVVPPEQTPGPGQLRDSHTDFLSSAVASLGLKADSLGIAPDEPTELRRLIEAGLEYDLLLLGGGVSMGVFDYVEGVLDSLGCEILFDAVSVQPGKPLVGAKVGKTLILGLPGNPASVMACFWLFARPVLRCLIGLQDSFWKGAIRATLTAPLPKAKNRDRFLPATISVRRGELQALPIQSQGSHDLSAFGRGSAMVRIPAHSEPREAGDPCEILPFSNWLPS